jgi:hypothetical protein
MTDHHDDTMNASPADEPETTVVESNTAQAAELAWSRDDGVDDQGSQRYSWLSVWSIVGVIAACSVVAAIVVWLSHNRHHVASPAAPTTTVAAPTTSAGASPPATVTVTAPPPVTVTAAPPTLEGVDAKFISFLRSNDIDSYFVRLSDHEAIADAHLVCNDMLHGTPTQNVADNLPGISTQQLAWFIDTASANYCPQFGGDA